jgi:putative protease
MYSDHIMEPEYTKVGRITHFYPKAGVAVLEVLASIRKGDRIAIRGSTTNISQVVESMEIEHKPLNEAQAGQKVGLKVAGRVRENDMVYKVA